MKFPLRTLLLLGIVAAAGPLVARRARNAPVAATSPESDARVASFSRRFLNFVLLPGWMIWGFADYVCHRRSDIEHTSGTHESLTHLLMIASTGVGVTTAMFFEVNGLVLGIMAASTLAHEMIVLWDVGYAVKLRPPSATEQHVHSFLEVLPFTGLAVSVCLNPSDAVAMLHGETRAAQLRLTPKRHPRAPLYNATVIALVTLTLAIPYVEEFVRCWRVDHTLLPHAPKHDGAETRLAKRGDGAVEHRDERRA